jgi:hypothetical protein
MKINQIIVENFDGEYDDEAGMAQTNLHTIARAAQGLLDTIDNKENLPEWVQEKIAKVEGMMVTAWDYLLSQEEQGTDPQMMEAANAAQQAAIAISMKKAGKKPKNESAELEEEFDLIESIIERLAAHNGVDAEVIWEDLETLTEDELYAFAVTSEPIMENQGVAEGDNSDVADISDSDYMRIKGIVDKKYPGYELSGLNIGRDGNIEVEIYNYKTHDTKHLKTKSTSENKQDVSEDWQKANKRDKTDGMSQKAVNAYRRENPGSTLKTAVTTKPSKLKKGGKASKRRKSYCSRSRGQMKMHSISCAKTPDKAICKARRRWNC